MSVDAELSRLSNTPQMKVTIVNEGSILEDGAVYYLQCTGATNKHVVLPFHSFYEVELFGWTDELFSQCFRLL